MKKIFLTTILFLLALSILASELDMTAPMIVPSFGITIDQLTQHSELNQLSPLVDPSSEPINSEPFYEYWAAADLPAAPFDGTLDLAVVGSPLPSPLATMIAALGTLGIIYTCKLQSTKQAKSLR